MTNSKKFSVNTPNISLCNHSRASSLGCCAWRSRNYNRLSNSTKCINSPLWLPWMITGSSRSSTMKGSGKQESSSCRCIPRSTTYLCWSRLSIRSIFLSPRLKIITRQKETNRSIMSPKRKWETSVGSSNRIGVGRTSSKITILGVLRKNCRWRLMDRNSQGRVRRAASYQLWSYCRTTSRNIYFMIERLMYFWPF